MFFLKPLSSIYIVKLLIKSNESKEPKQQGIHISQPPLFPQPLDPCPCLLYRVEIREAETTAPYSPQSVTHPACPAVCGRRRYPCKALRGMARKWRQLLENFFCKLKESKKIAMRAEKMDSSFPQHLSGCHSLPCNSVNRS